MGALRGAGDRYEHDLPQRGGSQQRVKDIIWLPAVAAMPFMNYVTIQGVVKKRPMLYFIREIRNNRLSEIE